MRSFHRVARLMFCAGSVVGLAHLASAAGTGFGDVGAGGPAPTGRDSVAWINPFGGLYFDSGNWSLGAVPGPSDSILFDLDRWYAVILGQHATVADAEVREDRAAWWSVGRTRTLSGGLAEPALRVGAPDGADESRLELAGITVHARGASVAGEAGSHGEVRVGFLASLLISELPLVAGPGAGGVQVSEFGSLHAGAGIVALGGAGLSFGGDLTIGSLPGGLFFEGEASTASLRLDAQSGAQAAGFLTQGSDGVLEIELAARETPWIIAEGGGALGGVLHLTVAEGFTPEVGDEFELIGSLAALDGVFGLVFTEGLSGDDYLRVVYPDARGGTGVRAVVDQASGEIDFGGGDTDEIPPGTPTDTAVADVNRDDLLDVAVSIDNGPSTPGVVVVLLNNGLDMGGEWLGLGPTVQVSVGVSPRAIAATDIDFDGDDDIVAANTADDTVSVLWNQSTMAGPAPAFLVTTVPVGDEPVDVALGDFDTNGSIDIAVLCAGDQTVQILTIDGLRGFSSTSTHSSGGRGTSMSPADIDNDKDLDVVGSDEEEGARGAVVGGDSLFILENQGDGAYGPPVLTPTGAGPVKTITLDLQGDGLVDAVTIDRHGGTASLHTNALDGRAFTLRTQIDLGGAPLSVAALDAELDGDKDLASVVDGGPARSGPVIRILRNDASLAQPTAFNAQPDVVIDSAPALIDVGDMDRDGLPDIVAVAEDGTRGVSANVVAVLLNVGRPAILGELNGDCVVDTADVGYLIDWFGSNDPAADLNDDGVVDTIDLGMLLGNFGATCEGVLGG